MNFLSLYEMNAICSLVSSQANSTNPSGPSSAESPKAHQHRVLLFCSAPAQWLPWQEVCFVQRCSRCLKAKPQTSCRRGADGCAWPGAALKPTPQRDSDGGRSLPWEYAAPALGWHRRCAVTAMVHCSIPHGCHFRSPMRRS